MRCKLSVKGVVTAAVAADPETDRNTYAAEQDVIAQRTAPLLAAHTIARPSPPYTPQSSAVPKGESNDVLEVLTAELASIAAHGAAQGGDAAVAALTAVLAAINTSSQGKATALAYGDQKNPVAAKEQHIAWQDKLPHRDALAAAATATAAAEEAKVEAAAAAAAKHAREMAAEERLRKQHREQHLTIEAAKEEQLRAERIAANTRMINGYGNDASGGSDGSDDDVGVTFEPANQSHDRHDSTPSRRETRSSKQSQKQPTAATAAAASPWASGSVVYSSIRSTPKPAASPKPHHQHVPRGKPTQWGAIKRPRIPVHSTKSQQMREALVRPGSAGHSEVSLSRDTFGKVRSIDGSKVARHKQQSAKVVSTGMIAPPVRSAKVRGSGPALSSAGPPRIEVRQTRKSQGATNMTM